MSSVSPCSTEAAAFSPVVSGSPGGGFERLDVGVVLAFASGRSRRLSFRGVLGSKSVGRKSGVPLLRVGEAGRASELLTDSYSISNRGAATSSAMMSLLRGNFGPGCSSWRLGLPSLHRYLDHFVHRVDETELDLGPHLLGQVRPGPGCSRWTGRSCASRSCRLARILPLIRLTGSTLLRSVISLVMATSQRKGIFVTAENSATASVTPVMLRASGSLFRACGCGC